jgi:YVTN family beta-propeller protein
MLRLAERPAPTADGTGQARLPRRLRWMLLTVLALGVAGCLIVLTGGLSPGRAAAGAGQDVVEAGLVHVLPAGNRVVSGPRLPEVNSLASGIGGLWLTGGSGSQNHLLYAVNPVTSRIDATVALPSRQVINPGDLAVGPDAVWVAIGASLYRVVPGLAGTAVTHPFATLPLDGLIGDVVTAAGSVWVDDTVHGTVYRYAAATGRLAATVHVGGTAGVMAAGDGGVWVADPDARTVSRISVRRNHVDLVVRVPVAPTHLATTGDRLWATGGTDGVLVIGPGGRVRSVPVAGQPTGLAAAGGSVWVASTGAGTLSRIDARRAAVVATVRVGERPYAVATSPQGVWVAVLGQPMMDAAAARGSAKLGWLLRLCGIG